MHTVKTITLKLTAEQVAAFERVRVARGCRSRTEVIRALLADADGPRPPTLAPALAALLDAVETAVRANGGPVPARDLVGSEPILDALEALGFQAARRGDAFAPTVRIGVAFSKLAGRAAPDGRELLGRHDANGVHLWYVDRPFVPAP